MAKKAIKPEKKSVDTVPVYNTEGKQVDTLSLDKKVFDGIVNEAAIHQAIVMYQANLRRGNACAKTRSEVSGGGKKPWRQKGTGRARAGSIRSPLWRKGGVTFGPKPRDFHYEIPKKIKKLALRASLNAKIRDNELCVINEIKIAEPKTKLMSAILKALKMDHSSIAVLDKIDEKIERASRNIPVLTLKSAKDINAYDIMRHRNVLTTPETIKQLTRQLQ